MGSSPFMHDDDGQQLYNDDSYDVTLGLMMALNINPQDSDSDTATASTRATATALSSTPSSTHSLTPSSTPSSTLTGQKESDTIIDNTCIDNTCIDTCIDTFIGFVDNNDKRLSFAPIDTKGKRLSDARIESQKLKRLKTYKGCKCSGQCRDTTCFAWDGRFVE